MSQAVETRVADERVTLAALFFTFLKISLCGFGGGLVWARRILVERQRWVDDQEFAETLTLCQFMPGPNIVGITTCIGSKLRGAIGGRRCRGLHSDTLGGWVVAWWPLPSLRSPRDPAKHPWRAFRRCSRSDDRDRDPTAEAAPQSPEGAALCRPRLRRHGVRQAAAAPRSARLGA